MFHSLVLYFGYVFAPLFLLGAIKLRQADDTRGRKLLVTGFAMLTLLFVSQAAQYFEIYQLHYAPYMESDYHSVFYQYEDWERMFYWGTVLFRWIGLTIITVGFIVEGKAILRKLQKQSQNLPHSS